MADQKSLGGADATLVQPTVDGATVDKYRYSTSIADPNVLDARVSLAFVNGVYRLPVSLPVFQHTNDFWVEVARGNVPGFKSIQLVGSNPSVGTSFEDIWDVGGTLVYPTAGETWEIVSDSADDTDTTGTGARTVTMTYLDDALVEQTEILNMNGTTPVTFVATDAFRAIRCRVATWGSTLENQGNIDIRVSGGGSPRCKIIRDVIVPADPIGQNTSLDVHYTVPANKIGFIISITTNVAKGQDAILRALLRRTSSDGFTVSGELSAYQNSFVSEFDKGLTALPAGTDLKIIARSSNVAAPTSVFISILEVDV